MELVTLKQLFQRLNGGRLLGLDVGSRNIGIAVSDPHCRIGSSHSVLYWTQSTVLKNISWLESLVQELSITGFVIGYSLELTGFQGKEVVFSFCTLMHITLSALDVSFLSMFVDITTQVAQMKLFVRELQLSEQFPKISYIYWDERLTFLAVTNVIVSMDISGWHRKSIIDKMSALCILQGCLDSLTQLENGTKCS
ncbi:hypothetical protein BDL97_15G064100 [Sphagnum fallax]|nr:hypothetical protein BDL97_15G064100 [Sphagnum fallax]